MFSLPLSGRAIFASGLGAVLFSFVLVALWSVTALAARTWYPVSASHIIRFADSSKLSESLDPYQSPQQVRASVAIINEGTGAVTNPHFIARLTDPKGNEVNTVQVSSAATTIQPLQTSWFLLTFKLTQPIRKPTYVLSGVLEAGGPGTVPATRPLELTADRTLAAYEGITLTGGVASFLELFRLRSLATSIVVISFIVALIFMIARLTWRVWSSLWTGGHFRSRMIGTSGWDFSSSWASTLTAVGALIGTILSAGVIPDVPDHLSKPAYAGLNLFFGMLILIGPFAYKTIRPSGQSGSAPAPSGPPIEIGYTALFLVASLLTVWAVLGEMSTTVFLLHELAKQGSLTPAMIWIFRAVLVGMVFGLGYYTWTSIPVLIQNQAQPAATAKQAARETHARVTAALAEAVVKAAAAQPEAKGVLPETEAEEAEALPAPRWSWL